jgi:hypothetical protein
LSAGNLDQPFRNVLPSKSYGKSHVNTVTALLKFYRMTATILKHEITNIDMPILLRSHLFFIEFKP